MYSPDLVKTASTWAHRAPGSGINNGLANSTEWERIAPATLKLQPRYSEAYKKRMDMPPNFHPDVAPGTILGMNLSSSTSSYRSNASGTSTLPDPDYFGLGVRENEDRFRSLTDLKWGEFETMGFSELGDNRKLQFDLTESARLVCVCSLPFIASLTFIQTHRNELLSANRCRGTTFLLPDFRVWTPL
jgi:hypothetical protein